MSKEQAAYLAGFIDGDGSIVAQIVKKDDYVLRYQLRVLIMCVQKKRRSHYLKQIQKQLGAGVFRDRGDGMAEITFVGKLNVLELLAQIRPYLRIKRKQANLITRISEQLGQLQNDPVKFLELCALADRIAELNDSKARTNNVSMVRRSFIEFGFIQE